MVRICVIRAPKKLAEPRFPLLHDAGEILSYFTFHSMMPAETRSCIFSSIFSADAVTGLNVSLLYLSFSTP